MTIPSELPPQRRLNTVIILGSTMTLLVVSVIAYSLLDLPPKNTASYTIDIRTRADKKPIAGMRITLEPKYIGATIRVITDENGSAFITGVTSRELLWTINDPICGKRERVVNLIMSPRVKTLTVDIERPTKACRKLSITTQTT